MTLRGQGSGSIAADSAHACARGDSICGHYILKHSDATTREAQRIKKSKTIFYIYYNYTSK